MRNTDGTNPMTQMMFFSYFFKSIGPNVTNQNASWLLGRFCRVQPIIKSCMTSGISAITTETRKVPKYCNAAEYSTLKITRSVCDPKPAASGQILKSSKPVRLDEAEVSIFSVAALKVERKFDWEGE